MSLTQEASRVTSLKRKRSAKVSKKPSSLPKHSAQQVQVAPALAQPTAPESLPNTWNYGLDIWQRSILFWDTLRERADNMLEHERAGLPPNHVDRSP